jgi:ATP/maltotriose-dependent transcriptional regulator MalT
MRVAKEQQVVSLLFKGYLYREIGGELGISLCTMRVHLHEVYQRFQVKSRAQALAKMLGVRSGNEI